MYRKTFENRTRFRIVHRYRFRQLNEMLSFQSGSNTVPLRITGWVAFSFKTTHAWVLCVTAATAFAGQSPFDTGPPPPWWLTPLQQYPANASESWVWQALHWPPFSWHSPQQIELGSSTHFCSKRLFFSQKLTTKINLQFGKWPIFIDY